MFQTGKTCFIGKHIGVTNCDPLSQGTPPFLLASMTVEDTKQISPQLHRCAGNPAGWLGIPGQKSTTAQPEPQHRPTDASFLLRGILLPQSYVWIFVDVFRSLSMSIFCFMYLRERNPQQHQTQAHEQPSWTWISSAFVDFDDLKPANEPDIALGIRDVSVSNTRHHLHSFWWMFFFLICDL